MIFITFIVPTSVNVAPEIRLIANVNFDQFKNIFKEHLLLILLLWMELNKTFKIPYERKLSTAPCMNEPRFVSLNI